jgi:hypothetical protein
VPRAVVNGVRRTAYKNVFLVVIKQGGSTYALSIKVEKAKAFVISYYLRY